MMKKLTLLSSLFALVIAMPEAFAAEVEVSWIAPDKYRDIYAGNENRKRFKEDVFRELEQHFAKLAEKLPAEQKLFIKVTDVDLAGDVNHGGIDRVRIIKEIFSPRIDFSYQLVDAKQVTLLSGEIKLKDMAFMMHSALKYRHDRFGYEKQMLDQWFKKTFAAHEIKKAD